jgi:signal transduction histidine kinase/DNA-binding NarL/FixJ family response regulator
LLERAQSLFDIGQHHYTKNEFELAAQHLSQALLLIQNSGQRTEHGVLALMAKCLKSLGMVHYIMGNFSAALEFLMRADSLQEFISPTPKEQIQLNNTIAAIQSALSDYDSAIAMLDRSLRIARENALVQAEAVTLNNMGNVHYRMKQYDLALLHYEESLAIRLTQGVPSEIAVARYGVGNVRFEKGDFDGTKQDYESCLTIVEQTNDQKLKAHILEALGRLYLSPSFSAYNPEQAILYFNDALLLAEALQFKRLIYLTLEQRSVAFELIGNYQNALADERRARRIKDDVVGEEQQKTTRALTVLHQTEQAKKDAELERLKNIELANALKKVEEANAFKTELLGIAAHDLKNPLQVISGFSSLIDETSSLDEAKQHATLIQSSSARMLKLIKDLLETAALDSGKLELNKIPVNLADLLRAVAEHNRPNAEKKSQTIELALEENAIMEIDVERMREVFENLVSNAVKYSPNGKRIVVGSRRSELGIVAFVKDEGQGLTEEDKQKLFGKFQRLSARPTGGESSTGLGLSIVKQLVELHGGKVWAESDGKDKGTTFFVELPTMKGQRHISEKEHTKRSRSPGKAVQRSATVTRKKSKQKKIRVAVVEDLIEFRDSMVSLLSNAEGIEFMGEYGSVEDALIAMPQVDVVLMDIGLPGISGIDAIAKVKEKFSETQLLMLTVFNDDKHISRAMMAGASGYLLKNTPHPQILEAIAQVYDGGMPISAGIAKRIIRLYQQYAPSENSSASLTKREKEILSLLVKGLSFAQISDKLFISYNTVVNHMRKVYEKMHVHSKSEVVAKAIREGLV